jgi:hypothetical protein
MWPPGPRVLQGPGSPLAGFHVRGLPSSELPSGTVKCVADLTRIVRIRLLSSPSWLVLIARADG